MEVLRNQIPELLNPSDYLTEPECIPTQAYFVESSGIGWIAVYEKLIDTPDDAAGYFVGIRPGNGRYQLGRERHADFAGGHGTVRPIYSPDTARYMIDEYYFIKKMIDLSFHEGFQYLKWLEKLCEDTGNDQACVERKDAFERRLDLMRVAKTDSDNGNLYVPGTITIMSDLLC